MPLPLLFIGVAAATGMTGVGSTVKAVSDKSKAKQIVDIANKSIEDAKERLEDQRDYVSMSLNELGRIKVTVLEGNVMRFLDTFEKIKNVDFKDSLGLNEIKKLKIDHKDFEELKVMGNMAIELTQGATLGVASGALTAFGAYSAAGALAYASTGTAIASLSGAAATNATLAFFGGGSLAAGGLGMAGGTMVLGGLVAGPALMVMGLVTNVQAHKQLDEALANKAEADKAVEELNLMSYQCSAIRRRSYMFYELLARLDLRFYSLIQKMEEVVSQEGTDYSKYSLSSKKTVAMTAASAVTIKSILDTPILDGDGNLTDESDHLIKGINDILNNY